MGAEFKIENDVLVKYEGKDTVVVIPDGVTKIGENAFDGNKTLTELTMPNTVTFIGKYAFRKCAKLKSVVFSNALEEIEYDGFIDCKALKAIELPKTLRSLGSGVFAGCSKLTSVKCESDVFEAGSDPFSDFSSTPCTQLADKQGFLIFCGVLYAYYGTATEIAIPEGVKTIIGGTFKSGTYNWEKKLDIKSVEIPASVKEIGNYAFANNKKLKTIKMPSGVKLGTGVFDGCDNLADENGFFVFEGVAYAYFGDNENVVVSEGVKELFTGLFANRKMHTIEAELRDYARLQKAGIHIPRMHTVDIEAERIVKDYIEGSTVMELLNSGTSVEPYLPQVRDMADKAMAAGLNIDYYPTNFVLHDGLLWYVDYFNINSPKTEAGVRQIPMLEFVKEAFLMEKKYHQEAGLECHSVIDGYSDFIFLNRNGEVYGQASLNKAIKRIIRDCNDEQFLRSESLEVLLPNFSCHSLRHTFTTRLCEAGTNIKLMQDILGHQDISTTMNIYADVTKELREKELGNLEAYFAKQKGERFHKGSGGTLNTREPPAFRFYSDILSNILKNELVCAIILHTVNRTVHEYTNTPKSTPSSS